MKIKAIAAMLSILVCSSAQAATLTYETAIASSRLDPGRNAAFTSYKATNLDDQTAAADRREDITGFERGLVAQNDVQNFVNTIGGTRPVVGSTTNTSRGFFKTSDFFVDVDIFVSATCLRNPTAGTCPPKTEAENRFIFDFSVEEAVTLSFGGFYNRGADTRHISDDQTSISIANANRDREVFFSGSSNPNFGNNIFDSTSGYFSGQLELEAGISYRFSLFQAASATGGPAGVEITDQANFLFGATLSTDPIDLVAFTSQLNAEIAEVSAVPLPAAGWMLIAAFGGLGALRRRKSEKV